MAERSVLTPLVKFLRPIRTVTPIDSTNLSTSRPYRYSQSPLKLFFEDAATFRHVLWTIGDLARPRKATNASGDELEESWPARRDAIIIATVSVLQVFMVLFGFIAVLLLPGLLSASFVALMLALTFLLLKPTQGPRLVESKAQLVGNDDTTQVPVDANEKWIFLNGIMTGHYSLQNGVNTLSRIFKRPVLGIHNNTQGFLGDIFECLMQRCFSYSTRDVRVAYDEVYRHITDPTIHKIVLIAHSQGGIIASLVLDRLLTELPQELIGKLEIYTFASASSHFNNPSHRAGSGSPSALQTEERSTDVGKGAIATEHIATSTLDATEAKFVPCPEHVVLNIEHYANEYDPIPRWGILNAYQALEDTRYNGRLFVRMGTSGHFFTSHYLAVWFPQDAERANMTKQQSVTVDKGLLQRNNSITPTQPVSYLRRYDSMLEEATHMAWGNNIRPTKEDLERMEEARARLGEGQFHVLDGQAKSNQRMEQYSRLWQYVGRGVPN